MKATMKNTKRVKGDSPQTGNYDSRDMLVQNVHYLYHQENLSSAQVAEAAGIHRAAVEAILLPARKL